jgi:ketosteroid isomerase-like protein
MELKLPPIISAYINASNAHDVEAILACFSDQATVRDENETLHGKEAIRGWITKTNEKYDFHFEPLRAHPEDDEEILVVVSVSGTFPGSPVTLEYLFTTSNGNIASLSVE